MEHRFLGASGFKVPVLSFGTGTFGGKGEFFEAWGATDVAEARRLIDGDGVEANSHRGLLLGSGTQARQKPGDGLQQIFAAERLGQVIIRARGQPRWSPHRC